MRIILNGLRILFLACCLLLQLTTVVWAQNKMTKIKDGTIGGTSTEPFDGAILELESKAKGFLLPRMTTAERDAIPNARKINGLIIFNTTTNCINYWVEVTNNWLSLCGTPPPAVMTIPNCNNVKINGLLKEGVNLDASNYLEIPVSVSQPGTYDILASTDNGYYFSVSGTFPASGNYTLYLPGTGKPRRGYQPGEDGDKLKITMQGVVLTDCEPNLFVENAEVAYTLTCQSTSAQGLYMLGIPLTELNFISVAVNITQVGDWSMWTPEVNGYSFKGEGTFNSTGTQIVHLMGSGVPLSNDPTTDTFSVLTNSDASSGTTTCDVLINLQQVAYTIDCANAVVKGTYKQDVPLTLDNTIEIEIDVVKTGDITDIKATGPGGISFSSGPLALRALGKQKVVLQGSGTPTGTNDIMLTVLGTPTGGSTSCQVTVPVEAQPVNYTTTCNSIQAIGAYAPNVDMKPSNQIKLDVIVSYPGAWTISTQTENGVTFSGSGTFATTGQQTVYLNATGKGTTDGTFTYNITTNSATSSSCSVEIPFIYRKMNLLGYGGTAYTPIPGSSNYTASVIPKTTANFGPTGTVKMEGFNVFNSGSLSASALSTYINTNNIDIIVTGYGANITSATAAVLVDFIVNKKGVVIVQQQDDLSGLAALINGVAGGSVSLTKPGSKHYNISNLNDPIINGPFGDVRGKVFGGDRSDNYAFGNLSSSLVGLADHASAGTYALIRHTTLGLFVSGDGGAYVGGVTRGDSDSYPARINSSGAPVVNTAYTPNTYNSHIYANALAWAVKYVQENTLEAIDVAPGTD
ncbi:hypothetical protein E2P86_13205 [Sphingobacterium psychroaquaticum]|uniref:hypothetical protein n=1 Tax=Sphingobacterium psychroaquaticum TaxID=561061 RepID=UPI00106D600F|nr:hypothetical protein [Sphingobacterium psychroaquaticum]QBQ42053.1 hypothetical protein E2P86_13205 [Sphingobacterium psychroaquaticum]